ncbi:hypothetical protein BT96DRAFT_957838 [Gymnopus androsaceus JB14]|uniref:Tc1-like transposase DDE domain-containing protein n=1 Tax=Gymnopus androsaceus JB14 TaxID=1447944 RepID=A0A6A4HIV5_9AGAR|nr:hypothetical protein BT96DRAFT_957838 [Gymnopus androsaceus JB14]
MFPGKAKDGYFTAADILEQANAAIDLVNKLYLEFDYVFIYNNATTISNTKILLSLHVRMPKGPSLNFHGFVADHDADGNIVHLPDRSVSKVKVQMGPATFEDGSPQELIAVILKEHGIKCTTPMIDCCCCYVLYNQTDFVNLAREHGVPVMFLPKFHCKLNPIEQCWGYAKRLYQFYPESSCEDNLKRNTIEFLDSVPLESIRCFFNQAHKFIDAYCKGLNGWQAAWAACKYKGHQILPDTVMDDLEKVNIS